MKAEWTNRDSLSIETTSQNNKAVLVIDMPNRCIECPLCSKDENHWGDIVSAECQMQYKGYVVLNEKPKWCPLRHPLKEVSSDFYIYDRKYLFDNLDREIDLLKGAKEFKEFMKAREDRGETE